MSDNGLEVLSREMAADFSPLRHLASPAQVTTFFHDLGYAAAPLTPFDTTL